MVKHQTTLSPTDDTLPIVFVLDDDDAVRDSIQILLKTEGYESEAFDSVQKFLKGLASAPRSPDCVILDVHLPDGDGRILSTALTAERPELPVILMSGHNSGTFDGDAAAAGAMAFLDKPINHDDLFKALARAIAQ